MLTVKVKQDLSGHVCFDNQQARFYQHSEERANKINCARKNGILKHKPSRNPLAAEATPRVDYKGFDYTPPVAAIEPERWVYPESDWGLMQKFESQKKVYAVLEETSKKCDESIKKYQAIKAGAASIIAPEVVKPVLSSRDMNFGPTDGEFDELTMNEKTKPKYERANANSKAMMSMVGRNVTTKAHHVMALKTLRPAHPEIIEKYRADRAASFVNRQNHPLEPPTQRELERRVYCPAGGPAPDLSSTLPQQGKVKVKEAKSKRVAQVHHHHQQEAAPERSTEQQKKDSAHRLDYLRKQLHDTQNEIDRQELKLAIHNPPPKRYEMAVTKSEKSKKMDLTASPR